MKNNKHNKKGFTLVEMMVSVAIFTIIMTVGIGALVSMLDKYKYAQETKQVSDSLNFVLEGLTREIRLGYNYCSRNGVTPAVSGGCDGIITVDMNGSAGSTTDLIGFVASDNRGYIVYGVNNGVLYRRVWEKASNGYYAETPKLEHLTDKNSIVINHARFQVMNAEDTEDKTQPLVWFQIVASPKTADVSDTESYSSKSYTIQSLVSQRVLDA